MTQLQPWLRLSWCGEGRSYVLRHSPGGGRPPSSHSQHSRLNTTTGSEWILPSSSQLRTEIFPDQRAERKKEIRYSILAVGVSRLQTTEYRAPSRCSGAAPSHHPKISLPATPLLGTDRAVSRRTRWWRRRICLPTSKLNSPRGLIILVLFSFVLFPYSLTPHQIPEQKKCIRIVRLPMVVRETAVEDKIRRYFFPVCIYIYILLYCSSQLYS